MKADTMENCVIGSENMIKKIVGLEKPNHKLGIRIIRRKA
jgi:hypothetical protein